MSAPGATFTTPITLNVYRASSTDSFGETTPGGLILTKTKTFTIPYRPSADNVHCTGAGDTGHQGEWFKNGQGCFNGLAHTITFTLSGLHVVVQIPAQVIRSARRLVWRLLTYRPSVDALLVMHEQIRRPLRC